MRPLVLNIVNASHVNALKSVLFAVGFVHEISRHGWRSSQLDFIIVIRLLKES